MTDIQGILWAKYHSATIGWEGKGKVTIARCEKFATLYEKFEFFSARFWGEKFEILRFSNDDISFQDEYLKTQHGGTMFRTLHPQTYTWDKRYKLQITLWAVPEPTWNCGVITMTMLKPYWSRHEAALLAGYRITWAQLGKKKNQASTQPRRRSKTNRDKGCSL